MLVTFQPVENSRNGRTLYQSPGDCQFNLQSNSRGGAAVNVGVGDGPNVTSGDGVAEEVGVHVAEGGGGCVAVGSGVDVGVRVGLGVGVSEGGTTSESAALHAAHRNTRVIRAEALRMGARIVFRNGEALPKESGHRAPLNRPCRHDTMP